MVPSTRSAATSCDTVRRNVGVGIPEAGDRWGFDAEAHVDLVHQDLDTAANIVDRVSVDQVGVQIIELPEQVVQFDQVPSLFRRRLRTPAFNDLLR